MFITRKVYMRGKLVYLSTEKSRVEKARTAAIERIVIFSRDSCFSRLNLPNTGAWITPLATVILTQDI